MPVRVIEIILNAPKHEISTYMTSANDPMSHSGAGISLWRDLALTIVGGVGGAVLAHDLLGVSLHFVNGWQALWVLMAAPALEEFVFRGLLQNGLQSHIRRIITRFGLADHSANVLTASCFALTHAPAQGWLALWWSLPSLLLGELWRRHRSVWLCALVHAAFNISLWSVSEWIL